MGTETGSPCLANICKVFFPVDATEDGIAAVVHPGATASFVNEAVVKEMNKWQKDTADRCLVDLLEVMAGGVDRYAKSKICKRVEAGAHRYFD